MPRSWCVKDTMARRSPCAALLDIALECARASDADPATLVRAARDFAGKNAEFSTEVALLALSGLLNGAGYDPDPATVRAAYDHLMVGAARTGTEAWAREQVAKLARQAASTCSNRWLICCSVIRPAPWVNCLMLHPRCP